MLFFVDRFLEYSVFYPIRILLQAEQEISIDEVYVPGSNIDMPKRPKWDYNICKEKLVAREEAYFQVSDQFKDM